MKIGVIDSGYGGSHICSLIRTRYEVEVAQWKPVYFRSYSDLSISDLRNQCDVHIEYLLQEKVDLIVIGCMTLSTNLSYYIKRKSGLPVVDLYEGLPYFDDETLIISTTNTAKSGMFDRYILFPCPDLASCIEEGYPSLIPGYLKGYEVSNRHNRTFTKVILGCSHYSNYKKEFEKYYQGLEIIDPVKYLMEKLDESVINLKSNRDTISVS